MSLRIPRRLRIRDRVWRVVLTREAPRFRGRACYGLCDHDRAVITLWRRRPRWALEETFAHELAHALAGRSWGRWSAAAEERIVSAMAGPLRALLVSRRRWRAPRRCGAARAVSAAGEPRGHVAG